jgi:hypothetical protein
MKIGHLTNNTDWEHAAEYFWHNVTEKRSVAFEEKVIANILIP